MLGVGNGLNAEGGVDYDAHFFNGPSGAIGRVWATSDAIHINGQNGYTDYVYGYQGLRPNLALGTTVTSKLIDSDGPTVNFLDKSQIGDIEVKLHSQVYLRISLREHQVGTFHAWLHATVNNDDEFAPAAKEFVKREILDMPSVG